MKPVVLFLLNIYIKYLSFDRGVLKVFSTGQTCKYSPTCSKYTYEAILRYGILKGSALGLKRISTCK